MSAAWPLPPQPHLPGRTPRPGADSPLYQITAPALTDPLLWLENAAWLAGLHYYANACFWEAHEMWEPVWLAARPNSQERELLQGLIQLANCGLKREMGQSAAAQRLARMALRHITEAGYGVEKMCMGVDMADLRGRVGEFAGGGLDGLMPQLHKLG